MVIQLKMKQMKTPKKPGQKIKRKTTEKTEKKKGGTRRGAFFPTCVCVCVCDERENVCFISSLFFFNKRNTMKLLNTFKEV